MQKTKSKRKRTIVEILQINRVSYLVYFSQKMCSVYFGVEKIRKKKIINNHLASIFTQQLFSRAAAVERLTTLTS